MAGVCRAGLDRTGNTILPDKQSTVFVEGSPVAVIGSKVVPYSQICSNPRMMTGAGGVFAEGMAVCRNGDRDTCGTPATGSGVVNAG